MFCGHHQEKLAADRCCRHHGRPRAGGESRLEGRPDPVHIHVPENLTHHGVEVSNYRDLRLVVKPVLPDPRAGRQIADYLADAFANGQEGRGAGRLRRDPQRCGRRGTRLDRALPDCRCSPRSMARASSTKAIRWRSACSATAATPRAWKAFLDADVVIAVGNSLNQHATFGYRDDSVRQSNAHPHQYLRDGDRQGLQGRLRAGLRRQAGASSR